MERQRLHYERAQGYEVSSTGKKLLREQGGFTLPEMMVTIVIMIVVMFALYSIFDMSIRVFSFGNDKVEAVDNARLGMEKMAREVRAAYAVDKGNGKSHLFWAPTYPNVPPSTASMPAANQITFGNDRNGNRKVDANEEITYKLGATGPPYTLQRVNGGVASSTVEFVKASGLTFTYLKSDGTTTAANEPEIAVVRIRLEISVPGNPPRTQTLTTDVSLRN